MRMYVLCAFTTIMHLLAREAGVSKAPISHRRPLSKITVGAKLFVYTPFPFSFLLPPIYFPVPSFSHTRLLGSPTHTCIYDDKVWAALWPAYRICRRFWCILSRKNRLSLDSFVEEFFCTFVISDQCGGLNLFVGDLNTSLVTIPCTFISRAYRYRITLQFLRWPKQITARTTMARTPTNNSYIIMFGCDCRNKCIFSFHWNTVNYEAHVMLSRRLFHRHPLARMLIPEPRHCQHVTVLVFVRWPCNVCAW